MEGVFNSCDDFLGVPVSLGYSSLGEPVNNDVLPSNEVVIQIVYPSCVQNFDVRQFQGYLYICWVDVSTQLFRNLVGIPMVVFFRQKYFCWLIDCEIEWLEFVR